MSKRDFYDILGVSKGASDSELKSAYRKLALKYHPDKNPGDKKAEQKFQEANEAYNTLKDPQKRAAYDKFGHNAFQGGAGGGQPGGNPFGAGGFDFGGAGGNFSDIFDDLFGGGGGHSRRRPTQVRGADLRYNITISLEEAFNGKTEQITFTAATGCDSCDGTGSADSKQKTCSTCNGAGKVRSQQGFFAIERPCHTCGGEGQVIENPCKKCNGSII